MAVAPPHSFAHLLSIEPNLWKPVAAVEQPCGGAFPPRLPLNEVPFLQRVVPTATRMANKKLLLFQASVAALQRISRLARPMAVAIPFERKWLAGQEIVESPGWPPDFVEHAKAFLLV